MCICCHCCRLHNSGHLDLNIGCWYFQIVDIFAKQAPNDEVLPLVLLPTTPKADYIFTSHAKYKYTWCKASTSGSSDTTVLYRTLQCRLRHKWPSINYKYLFTSLSTLEREVNRYLEIVLKLVTTDL